MRKFTFLFLSLWMLLPTSFLIAQNGDWADCGIYISKNSEQSQIYNFQNAGWTVVPTTFEGAPAFENQDFGVVNSLRITGGVAAAWANRSGNYFYDTYSFRLYYRVYPVSEAGTTDITYESFGINVQSYQSGNNWEFKVTDKDFELTEGLAPGFYYLEVLMERARWLTGSPESRTKIPGNTSFDSNEPGEGYKVTFEIAGSDNLDFMVEVPDGTESCYIKAEGSTEYLQMIAGNGNTYTLTVNNVDQTSYLYNYYTLDSTNNLYIKETDASGNILSPRSYASSDVVVGWEVVEPIVVIFEKPTGWDAVNIWAWNSEGNLFPEGWPGVPMAQMQYHTDWYEYEFDIQYREINILFNDGKASGTQQTANIMGVTKSTCYDSSGTETMCPDVSTSIEEIHAKEIMVRGEKNEIKIALKEASFIEIYTVTGQQILSVTASGNINYVVNSGVYIIRIDGKSYKVLVK